MTRIASLAFFLAALTALPSSSVAQGGGHQLQTWDSSDWVPFSVHGGVQPVNGWWFYGYENDGSHDIGDLTPMTWYSASAQTESCDHTLLPDCWLLEESGQSCCYIAQHVAGPPEHEQSSSSLASVRRWQAPGDGTVMITTPNGNVRKAVGSTLGDGSWIRIYRNDLLFFEQHLAANDTTGFAIDDEIDVNAGDDLWFHNDPGTTIDDDEVVFLPFLTFSAGPGYDPSVQTRASVADFQADFAQGANGWTYEAFQLSSGTYAQMTVPGTDAFGRFWQQGTVCKVWSDRQHPSATHDAVRVWTVPQDGFLLLESLSIAEKLSAGDPVEVEVRHIHAGGTTILCHETITDQAGAPLGAVANVRTGDRIAIHATALVGSPQTSHVNIDVELKLHPMGEFPRTFVDHGVGDVVIDDEVFWFYEEHEIEGNLVLESGHLRVQDSSVALMNSYEKEFNYKFESGELSTVESTIGGGTTTGQPLHSNFEFFHPGVGIWHTRNTTVQYTYGTLLSDSNDPSILEGTGHMAGPHSDLIHMGENAEVTLADSLYYFRLMFPADDPAGIVADLPVNTPITTTLGANEFPGVTWSLDLTNTTALAWNLAAFDMQAGGITKYVKLDNVAKVWAEMDGTNLTGSATPFVGTITTTPSGPSERAFVDTFNVRWRAGANPAELQLWAVYLDGHGTDVVLNGLGDQSLIAELITWNGADVDYVGTAALPARSMATVILCSDPGTNLLLQNCELGTTFTKGSIRAEAGAYIKIDSAKLVNDIALEAVGSGSIIEVVNLDPSSPGQFDACVSGGGQIIGLGTPPICD